MRYRLTGPPSKSLPIVRFHLPRPTIRLRLLDLAKHFTSPASFLRVSARPPAALPTAERRGARRPRAALRLFHAANGVGALRGRADGAVGRYGGGVMQVGNFGGSGGPPPPIFYWARPKIKWVLFALASRPRDMYVCLAASSPPPPIRESTRARPLFVCIARILQES